MFENLGTKHAVRAVTESMRQELNKLKDTKIRVCVSIGSNFSECYEIKKNNLQEISPGAVESEITADFFNKPEIQKYIQGNTIPILKGSDLAQTVQFMLMTPYDVNITELIVRPAGGS